MRPSPRLVVMRTGRGRALGRQPVLLPPPLHPRPRERLQQLQDRRRAVRLCPGRKPPKRDVKREGRLSALLHAHSKAPHKTDLL
jgi:hypothetical protein